MSILNGLRGEYLLKQIVMGGFASFLLSGCAEVIVGAALAPVAAVAVGADALVGNATETANARRALAPKLVVLDPKGLVLAGPALRSPEELVHVVRQGATKCEIDYPSSYLDRDKQDQRARDGETFLFPECDGNKISYISLISVPAARSFRMVLTEKTAGAQPRTFYAIPRNYGKTLTVCKLSGAAKRNTTLGGDGIELEPFSFGCEIFETIKSSNGSTRRGKKTSTSTGAVYLEPIKPGLSRLVVWVNP